jgi:hypothetical protein
MTSIVSDKSHQKTILSRIGNSCSVIHRIGDSRGFRLLTASRSISTILFQIEPVCVSLARNVVKFETIHYPR